LTGSGYPQIFSGETMRQTPNVLEMQERARGPLSPCQVWWGSDFARRRVAKNVEFLANVNSRSRSLYAIASPSVCLSSVCLSVVCNVRTPYSGGSNFRQYLYGIRYLGHPLPPAENFTEIASGVKHKRGSQVFRTYRRLYLGNGARQEVS